MCPLNEKRKWNKKKKICPLIYRHNNKDHFLFVFLSNREVKNNRHKTCQIFKNESHIFKFNYNCVNLVKCFIQYATLVKCAATLLDFKEI